MVLLIGYIVIGIISDGNHVVIMPLIFVFSFILAFYIKKVKWMKQKTQLFYFSPLFFFFFFVLISSIVISIFTGIGFVYTFPYLMFVPLFFYLGYLFYKTKNIIYLIIIFPLLYINHAYIFPNSFSYFAFNHKVVDKSMPHVSFVNKDKTPVILSKDKIIVLDFWSTFCGICYDKFPEFESLYHQYQNNPNIEFYTVHVSYRSDKFEKTIKLLDKYNYGFQKLYALDSKEMEEKLDVKLFPTLIIIKNNKIRYRGTLITDNNVIIGNTIDNIESLLNE